MGVPKGGEYLDANQPTLEKDGVHAGASPYASYPYASSSSDCSMAAGILATDINVRATWFSNWSAFSSSARDFESSATTALWRSCWARFFAVVYPDIS